MWCRRVLMMVPLLPLRWAGATRHVAATPSSVAAGQQVPVKEFSPDEAPRQASAEEFSSDEALRFVRGLGGSPRFLQLLEAVDIVAPSLEQPRGATDARRGLRVGTQRRDGCRLCGEAEAEGGMSSGASEGAPATDAVAPAGVDLAERERVKKEKARARKRRQQERRAQRLKEEVENRTREEQEKQQVKWREAAARELLGRMRLGARQTEAEQAVEGLDLGMPRMIEQGMMVRDVAVWLLMTQTLAIDCDWRLRSQTVIRRYRAVFSVNYERGARYMALRMVDVETGQLQWRVPMLSIFMVGDNMMSLIGAIAEPPAEASRSRRASGGRGRSSVPYKAHGHTVSLSFIKITNGVPQGPIRVGVELGTYRVQCQTPWKKPTPLAVS